MNTPAAINGLLHDRRWRDLDDAVKKRLENIPSDSKTQITSPHREQSDEEGQSRWRSFNDGRNLEDKEPSSAGTEHPVLERISYRRPLRLADADEESSLERGRAILEAIRRAELRERGFESDRDNGGESDR